MSPVLAQAALTRNFDIQDEVEIKDDLEKNPDKLAEDVEIISKFKIAEAVTNFLSGFCCFHQVFSSRLRRLILRLKANC